MTKLEVFLLWNIYYFCKITLLYSEIYSLELEIKYSHYIYSNDDYFDFSTGSLEYDLDEKKITETKSNKIYNH